MLLKDIWSFCYWLLHRVIVAKQFRGHLRVFFILYIMLDVSLCHLYLFPLRSQFHYCLFSFLCLILVYLFCSNRDLSMILDALLKTKSRVVLLDIINKNGSVFLLVLRALNFIYHVSWNKEILVWILYFHFQVYRCCTTWWSSIEGTLKRFQFSGSFWRSACCEPTFDLTEHDLYHY